MTFGHRCFHSCATLPGTCAQCVEFKLVAGVATFDALFPKVGGAALGGEQQAKAAAAPPVTSAPISGGASTSSPKPAPVAPDGYLLSNIEAKRNEIQAELTKTPYTSDRFTMLYSAQQALGWAVAGMACPVELAKKWTNRDGSFIKPDEPAAKVCGDVDRLNTAARALYDLNPIVEEYGCSCGACDAEFTRFGWDTALELGLVDDYFEQAHAVLEAISA